jgi:SsrA-binding protein
VTRRRDEGERIVATNRKARHDFDILETVECGIQLTGDEVKSMRLGRTSLADCYGRIRGSEIWLEGMHVPPYEQGDPRRHQAVRPRKLLLHRRQIDQLASAVAEKGLSLVPLRVYFTHGIAKVELALARGRRRHEKRQAIATREAARETERELGRRR